MTPGRFLAMSLAFVACDASSHYEVYVAACEGFKCQQQSPPAKASRKHPLGGPMIPLSLGKITYSEDHKPVKREILSPVQQGLGYIDVDLKSGRALFASQGPQNVDTYVIDINSSASDAAPPTPKLLIGDRSALLAPCANTTYPGAIGGCVSANTFFARWSHTDSDEIIFAFETWTQLGDLAMAQGLGSVRSDGTGAKILTHDASVCPYGPCDGTMPPEKGFSDRCPLVLKGGKVVFTRSYNQDLKTRIAILDLSTGNVTVPENLPHPADYGGCPSADASGERFIYMACSEVDKYGSCVDDRSASATFSVGSVALSDPSVFVKNFPVPLIDSPNWEGTFATDACAYDRPSLGSISCAGATPQSNKVLKLAVDPKTGRPEAMDDISLVSVCMTAECFQAHIVDTSAVDVVV